MPIVMAVDPGTTGATAIYDGVSLHVEDMPIYEIPVGGKLRRRIDAYELNVILQYAKMYGVELVLIERVGGRKRQSASAGFNFGFGTGVIHMGCIANKLPIETVEPEVWKRVMRVPGKPESGAARRVALKAIEQVACKTFPAFVGLFYTAKRAPRIDRMEAAMMAKYCLDYVYKTDQPALITEDQWRIAYRR